MGKAPKPHVLSEVVDLRRHGKVSCIHRRFDFQSHCRKIDASIQARLGKADVEPKIHRKYADEHLPIVHEEVDKFYHKLKMQSSVEKAASNSRLALQHVGCTDVDLERGSLDRKSSVLAKSEVAARIEHFSAPDLSAPELLRAWLQIERLQKATIVTDDDAARHAEKVSAVFAENAAALQPDALDLLRAKVTRGIEQLRERLSGSL
jgi:hypothetical protein